MNALLPQIERMIDERTVARENKDYARADSIRDELREKNIALMDGPYGTEWEVAIDRTD